MPNIVGPFGPGINETTVRPADEASGLALDTWFKDCVPGIRQSGTIPTHTWLNKVCALFREAIRGMGVPEDELDDDMLLKALLAAQLNFENVSDGTSVHHELNVAANAHRLRSIKGVNISVAVEAETGAIILTGAVPEKTYAEIAPMMIVEEQRSGAAQPRFLPPDRTPVQRPLNTIIVNQIEGASLENEQVTLPAGTYRFKFAGSGFYCGNHHVQLLNVTASQLIARGGNADSSQNNINKTNVSLGLARATFAVETVVALQHRAFTTEGNVQRMGTPTNVSPDYHVDGWLAITKEA